MHSTLITLSALATSVLAVPVIERGSSNEVVGYWGNGSGRNLKDYCGSSSGIDIVVMSFIDQYGEGNAPSGGFNEPSSYCTINSDGSGSCPELASDITYCQQQGQKVLISLGGGGAPGNVAGQADAEGVAYSLWNSYGNPAYKDSGSTSPRPFGDVFVNGFDLDIEKPDGGDNYKYMISKLRSYFSRDPNNQYYISGAPQCVLPEANMGSTIDSSQFDYLWVQWYNNYQDCDASNYVYGPQAQGASFNYDAWTSYLAGTPSKNAKLVVGLPASQSAAASQSWIDPKDMPKLYDYVKSKPMFSGFMFWECSESDKYSVNGCNYAQSVKHILQTGQSC